jgi:hypothetical protein
MDETCACVRNHNPFPHTIQMHHVVPRSWLKKGAVPAIPELVPLCGTAHDSVHELLNQYIHHEGRPPWNVRRRFNDYIRRLAEQAWESKSAGKMPYTTSRG